MNIRTSKAALSGASEGCGSGPNCSPPPQDMIKRASISGGLLKEYCQLCDTLGTLIMYGQRDAAVLLCSFICDWVQALPKDD